MEQSHNGPSLLIPARAGPHVFSGVKPTSMGGGDGRWYGNRINFGKARDV